MTDQIDTSDLPTTIETPEDYIKVCEGFALPLMYQQAVKIMKAIEEFHEEAERDENISQERIDLYANRIKGYASFADDDSPMYPLLKKIADLETQFEEQGLFDEEGAND